jgi:hypothetical protein
MKELVLSLGVVAADDSSVRTGSRAKKCSAVYQPFSSAWLPPFVGGAVKVERTSASISIAVRASLFM